MLVVLAKLGSPAVVGKYTLGLAIAAPVFLFANLGLRTVQATDIDVRFSFPDLLGLRIATSTAALLAVTSIAYIAYKGDIGWVIATVALAKFAESISDVVYGYMQRRERMELIAKSMIMRGVLSVFIVFSLFKISGHLLWSLAGLVVVWVGVLFLYDFRRAGGYGGSWQVESLSAGWATSGPGLVVPSFKWPAMRQAIGVTLPVGVMALLISLIPNIPRYVIESRLGAHELGIFAAMAYLIVAGNILVNALCQAALPRMAARFRRGETRLAIALCFKLVLIAAGVGIAGVATAMFAGRELLTILYSAEYARRSDALVLLMWAGAASYVASIFTYALLAAQHYWVQIPIFAGVGLIAVASSLWLIPPAGVRGAAAAVLITMVAQLILSGLGAAILLRRKADHVEGVQGTS